MYHKVDAYKDKQETRKIMSQAPLHPLRDNTKFTLTNTMTTNFTPVSPRNNNPVAVTRRQHQLAYHKVVPLLRDVNNILLLLHTKNTKATRYNAIGRS